MTLSATTETVRCVRCPRSLTGSVVDGQLVVFARDVEGWAMKYEKIRGGPPRPVAYVCPDCLSPAEQAETTIREVGYRAFGETPS
jgi:hypothetical protein